jgi:hypothetical protein
VRSAPRNLPREFAVLDAQAYSEFTQSVALRAHVSALARDAHRRSFAAKITALAAGDNPRFTLDDWRLNLAATRPFPRD